jgi:hypothetical protein
MYFYRAVDVAMSATVLVGTEQPVCEVCRIENLGASSYICCSKECFEILKLLQAVKENVFGDGQELQATHAGVVPIMSYVLAGPVHLEEASFVSGAHCNLHFIPQAAMRGTKTVFKNGICWMYSNGMERARVHCIGKVYKRFDIACRVCAQPDMRLARVDVALRRRRGQSCTSRSAHKKWPQSCPMAYTQILPP